MDLIYTDANRIDQGVLSTYSFDLSFGKSENDFEMTLGADEPVLEFGAFAYIEGTEYGGIVDGRKAITDGESITYKGRTWHGMLNSKVVLPLQEGEETGKPTGRLPVGYTELTFIQSNGMQYVDTAFVPNQDTRVVLDIEIAEPVSSFHALFGAREKTSVGSFCVWINEGVIYPQYGNVGYAANPINTSPVGRMVIDMNRNVATVNGGSVTSAAATFNSVYPMALFSINSADTVDSRCTKGKLYSCQIYDNNILARDFVPCVNGDGAAGLYDIVNGTFYGNAGSGTFTAGDVAETAASDAVGGVSLEEADKNGLSYENRYLVISGDANACIGYMLNRLGVSDLFEASSAASGINIDKYKFNRYCKGYDGIKAMLEANGAKLKIIWKDRFVRLYAEAIVDYTEAPVDGDTATLTVEQYGQKVNHLICLGTGELAEREVVHLYVDQFGRISDTQYYTGIDEVAEVYDFSNTESSDELLTGGKKRLKELRGTDTAEISITEGDDMSYDIGDIVGATDIRFGVSATATVVQKIVRINNGAICTEYQTGG